MKKVLAIAFIAGIAFTACKKEYTCECTYEDASGQTASSSTTIKDTKKNAEDACEGNEVSSGGSTWTCELK